MRKLFNFLLAMPLLMLAACSSDKDNAPEPSTQTYTMMGNTGSIESRVTYQDVSNTMYCRWEEGDIVTLANAGGDRYDFVVKSVDADGVGTMAYDGVIPSADNFTGTATYAPRDDAKAGIQTANDNTEHLKYGEAMVATLTNQKIDGAKLIFSHPSTAVYKVTFKAPVAFTAGSKLTMRGAWTEDAVLTLNFSASKDDIVIAFLIHTAGTLATGGKMKFSLAVKDGDTYSYTFESKKSFSYEAGKYWLANISGKVMEKEYLVPEYVDLGLPSGTLWATCNLGASKPEEYGDYFGWGCTEPYAEDENINWGLYFQKIGGTGYTQYHCGTDMDPLKDYTVTYNVGIAGTKWDAATQKLGDLWRIPTYDQLKELYDKTYCDWQWTTENGVNGYRVTSLISGHTDKYIFLPAAGYRISNSVKYENENGYYWGPQSGNGYVACSIQFGTSGFGWNTYRNHGNSIRPVYAYTIPTPPTPTPKPEAVDLGLSVKWASFNLGASKPEECGDYYGWGCHEPYATSENVNWPLYFQKLGGTGGVKEDCGTDKDPLKNYVYPNKTCISGTQWDVARQKLGDNWRLPTHDEMRELMNSTNCELVLSTENGVNGYRVVSKVVGYEGNYVFLPFAGHRYNTTLYDEGSIGYYASSSPHSSYTYYAHVMCFFSSNNYYTGYGWRIYGNSIRPVTD